EARMQRVPVATNDRDTSATQRTLVVGLITGGAARAYPLELLVAQSPVNDKVGNTPVLLVVNEDGRSVRAFERELDGRAVEFFAKSESLFNSEHCPCRLLDAATGSEWDFTGRATAGPLAGRQLKQLPVLYDYWF